MTNEVTNQNNAWTLLKHTAQSVNHAAGKVDAKVYGPIVKQGTVQLPPQPKASPVKSDLNFFTIIGIIVVTLAFIGVAIAFCTGHLKGRDIIGF